jgi:hypothetical protein
MRIRTLEQKAAALRGPYLEEFLVEEYFDIFYLRPLEYPPHWSPAVGETLEYLRGDLKERIGPDVVFNDVLILTTPRLLKTPSKEHRNQAYGLIPPTSVEVKASNFALYYKSNEGWRCDMILLGGIPYVLDGSGVDASKSEREKLVMMAKETTRDGVLHGYESNKAARTCITNAPTRVGPDKSNPQDMVVYGLRSAKQVDSYNHHCGLHSKGGEVLLAQEAIGSGVIAAVNKYIIRPYFSGQLWKLMDECVDYGACIFPSLPPFTLGSITKNYCNCSHTDDIDLAGSFIVWFHAGEGTLKGGGFCCSSHGCHIVPKDGHVLYLNTPDVFHHSSPPRTTGTRCLLGIGLAANKNVITNLKNELTGVLEGVAVPLLTTEGDIPNDLKTGVVENLLNIVSKVTSNNKKRKL